MERKNILISVGLFFALLGLLLYGALVIGTPRTETVDAEIYAELDVAPSAISFSRDGRLFATVHPFRDTEIKLIEILPDRSYVPWPNSQWNSKGSATQQIHAPIDMLIDSLNRLWVLDNAYGHPQSRPRVMAFHVRTGKLLFNYLIPRSSAPEGNFLSAIAVDEARKLVYIADAGGVSNPGLIVLNAQKRNSTRMEEHTSFFPEDLDLVVENKMVTQLNAVGGWWPLRWGVSQLVLSDDRDTLYYGAMNSYYWYALDAKALREGKNDREVRSSIRIVGGKPISQTAFLDYNGRFLFTDVSQNAIGVLTRKKKLKTLAAHPGFRWGQDMDVGPDGKLYIAASQLNRSPVLNKREETGQLPYLIYRIKYK